MRNIVFAMIWRIYIMRNVVVWFIHLSLVPCL